MELEKFMFVQDVTNIPDLYRFYDEVFEDIKKTIYELLHTSGTIGANIHIISDEGARKVIDINMKNISTLSFNYGVLKGQAKAILERIQKLKSAGTLPISV
jgi:hypothetical protein